MICKILKFVVVFQFILSFSLLNSILADSQSTLQEIPAKVNGQIDPKDYFNVPFGIAVKNNILYVTDLGNTRIVKIDAATMQYIGDIVILDKHGKFKRFLLGRPVFDNNGNLWVSDMENGRILKIDESSGKIIDHFGSYGQKPGEFHASNGLAFDDSGSLWVADELNSRIQKCNPKNGKCQVYSMGDSSFPQDLAVKSGYLYVCVTWENKIKKFNLTNMQLVQEFGSNLLKHPRGIALDNQGKVYVSDNENNRVVIFTDSGQYVDAITGAMIVGPTGIKVDDNGKIYQAQSTYHFVTKYNSAKIQEGFAGKLRNLAYQLFYPLGASYNKTNIAICDVMNKRVQVYDLNGVYIKSVSPFFFPKSVLYGSDNKIYVADIDFAKGYNGVVRVYDSNWQFIKTIFFSEPFFPARLIMDKNQNLLASDYLNGKLFKISTSDDQILAKFSDSQKKLAGITINPETNIIYVVDSAKDEINKLNENLQLIGKFGVQGHEDGEFFGLSDISFLNKNMLLIGDSGNFRIQVFNSKEEWMATIGDLGLSYFHFFGLTVLRTFDNSMVLDVSSYLNYARSFQISKDFDKKGKKIKKHVKFNKNIINEKLKAKNLIIKEYKQLIENKDKKEIENNKDKIIQKLLEIYK